MLCIFSLKRKINRKKGGDCVVALLTHLVWTQGTTTDLWVQPRCNILNLMSYIDEDEEENYYGDNEDKYLYQEGECLC